MSKRKRLAVLISLVIIGSVVCGLLVLVFLTKMVGYENGRAIMQLLLIAGIVYIIALYHYRQQQVRSSQILLEAAPSGCAHGLTILSGVAIIYGSIFILAFLLQKTVLFEGLRGLFFIMVGWMLILMSRAKDRFTDDGIFSWIYLIRWSEIRAYRWQDSFLELHTARFLSPELIEMEPDKIAEARALLQRKMSSNQSYTQLV